MMERSKSMLHLALKPVMDLCKTLGKGCASQPASTHTFTFCPLPTTSNQTLATLTSDSAVTQHAAVSYAPCSRRTLILLIVVHLVGTCSRPLFTQITPYQLSAASLVDTSLTVRHTSACSQDILCICLPSGCDRGILSLNP